VRMASTIDLDAYFERIGYAGGRTPTLDTLRAVHLRHAQSIPFENLDPLIGRPVRLDMPALEQKLVHGRRGGYFFEQNLLLSHALRALGFQVVDLAARVLWNFPEGTINARSHMLLLVDLGEHAFVADVGFGGLTLTAPLRLEAAVAQETPHEMFRLTRHGDGFIMQAQVGGAWKPLYQFDLQEQFQADYEVTSWYLSNHPASRFVTNLIAARPGADCRHALLNNHLAIHHRGGVTEHRMLTTAEEIGTTLEGVFHLTLPDGPQLHAALQRAAASSAVA